VVSVAACLSIPSAVIAQSAPQACVSRAEQFIQTFGPPSEATALRTSRLEQEEQVKLAFYGIDATRAQIHSGRLNDKEGNFIIDGFEHTIRDYLHDKSNETRVTAAQGRASDIPTIAKSLQGPLSVARQDGLMGHEDLARQAQDQMINLLTTFSQKFSETCEQQSFPVEVALGLERQNQMLGTGISLEHCAKRKLSVDMDSERVHYHFEQCTFLGDGVWDVKLSGAVVGSGQGKVIQLDAADEWDGYWEIDGRVLGYPFSGSGHIKIVKEEVENKNAEATLPNDSSPLALPNHCPSVPAVASSVPQKVTVQKLRSTIIATRGGVYTDDHDTWVEGIISKSDKPCMQ
jgi:hypothetical protein